jgi:hypothetical protein
MLDALLASDSVGPWREDADAGRVRAEQVAASMSEPSEAVQARVYCASSSSSSSSDSFELTHLVCQGQLECVRLCGVCGGR